jgi:hypothetical protein
VTYTVFSTYGVSFGPLEVGYTATRVFFFFWIVYFGGQGLYWVLFNSGKINQLFQYSTASQFQLIHDTSQQQLG